MKHPLSKSLLLNTGEEKTVKDFLWTDKNNRTLEAMKQKTLQAFRNESSQVVEAPELVQGCWLPSGVWQREPGTWLHPAFLPIRSEVTATF